jgi:hypothetical protein
MSCWSYYALVAATNQSLIVKLELVEAFLAHCGSRTLHALVE